LLSTECFDISYLISFFWLGGLRSGEPGEADRFPFLPESLRGVAKKMTGSKPEPVPTGF
jgi:hypothetical protein